MDSFIDIYQAATEYFHENMSEVAYDLWFGDMKPVSFDGQTIRLSLLSAFKKNTVENRYMSMIKDGFRSVLGFDADIEIIVVDEEEAPPEKNSGYPYESGFSSLNYTFDNFIVGPMNKFAQAASWAVACNPAQAYNPLLLYGSSGLGKTHLMCAICTEIQKNHPDYRIMYVKSETFTNELIEAIKNKTTNEFHDKYRQLDVIAVDDIQFIAGMQSTQEEFFNTFNTLYHAGKQIIITSDRPPKEIKTLDDRIRTRLEWGLISDIQPPDFETRVAIIKTKSESLVMDMPDDVADFIANRIKKDIRQLEGIVKKMSAYQKLTDSPPSVMLAQKAIQDVITDNQPLPLTVERVVGEVARTFSVLPEDVRSKKQNGTISNARQVAMYILRDVTSMSMEEIGTEFGRDHATVVYATKKVASKMQQNTHFRETVEDIIKNIKSSR